MSRCPTPTHSATANIATHRLYLRKLPNWTLFQSTDVHFWSNRWRYSLALSQRRIYARPLRKNTGVAVSSCNETGFAKSIKMSRSSTLCMPPNKTIQGQGMRSFDVQCAETKFLWKISRQSAQVCLISTKLSKFTVTLATFGFYPFLGLLRFARLLY
jgi:hypothetical protein